LLDLNPRGLVPTLQYDNKPLYESTVLVEFLEEAFPDHTPHLQPADPYQRARTRIWTDFVTSRIIPGYHRFLQHQGEEGLQEKREEFLGYLKEFTREMDKEGPYFNGKEFGLIDVILAPWAVRLWVFDHFKGGLGVPEEGKGGEDEGTWGRWSASTTCLSTSGMRKIGRRASWRRLRAQARACRECLGAAGATDDSRSGVI
jgi:glutathione S-transferase